MYDKLTKLDKMIYDRDIAICNECKGYELCDQDLVGMKPSIVLENGKYVMRSVECGKRYGLILGKYKDTILSVPELYTSKDKLFKLLVDKENGFIRGNAGHGKSTLMLNIAKNFYKKGYTVMYDLAVNISTDLKDFANENESTAKKLNKYQDVDYLFIDDFARESLTTYKIMDIF